MKTSSNPIAPVVDRDELIERMMGNIDMAKRMLGRFVESSPAECDLIESTVRLGDKDSVASIAHRHKGTARTMASHRVARLAGELEMRAHSGQVSELLDLVHQLRIMHREVQEYVNDEFTETGSENSPAGK